MQVYRRLFLALRKKMVVCVYIYIYKRYQDCDCVVLLIKLLYKEWNRKLQSRIDARPMTLIGN